MVEEEKIQQSDNQSTSADNANSAPDSSDSSVTPPVNQEESQPSATENSAPESVPEESVDPPPSKERRNFLKVIATAGGILGLTPFIPYGSFFTATLGGTEPVRQKIMNSQTGSFVNISDMEPDSSVIFPFPRTGDTEKDSEPFRRYQLIRLAPDLGGEANDASSFRIYSMVCVHMWCLWDYIEGREVEVNGEKFTGNIECPCHGSNYDVRDGLSHKGPAVLQSKPNDALPTLPLEIDENGDVWVLPPDTALESNGIVGLGRYV